MDHTTCGGLVVVSGSDDRQTHEQEQEPPHIADAALSCLGAAAVALASYSFAIAAWRTRHHTEDVAFVLEAYAALAALLLCLRRAEWLTPDSPAAERRRLHFVVWALSTALSCAFAYHVSLLMPAALVIIIIIWCMTSFVVLMGFYMLVLCNCKDLHDQGLDDVTVGDREPLIKKTRPTDEVV